MHVTDRPDILSNEGNTQSAKSTEQPARQRWWSRRLATLLQLLHFGLVGILNTIVDLLIFNILLWVLPSKDTVMLLLYNTIAYACGAINSFLLNKYWTFHSRSRVRATEVGRFIATTIVALGCNDGLIWLANGVLRMLSENTFLTANVGKIIAIFGTMLLSYGGMRLWVFAQLPRAIKRREPMGSIRSTTDKHLDDTTTEALTASSPASSRTYKGSEPVFTQSLSVVLPAHNEETVIAETVSSAVSVLAQWVQDFELIVVNDGSVDNTAAVLSLLADAEPQLKVVTHTVNQGYGAALVSGFQAASKTLTFFMDADGQFDIRDIKPFFEASKHYDVVLGYRIDRQDTWVRKLNAWGWHLLVGLFLGVQVRDIDCAFKLYHSDFLHRHQLETRGAMINAEMLYKLKRDGDTFTELPVQHLPRLSGKATGARLSVILRAFGELFLYAYRWRIKKQL